MGNYILRRLLLMIPVIFFVSFGAFALLRMIPGSVVELKTGPGVSDEAKKELEHELGLDRPIYAQYFIWVGDLAQGDFGESLWSQQSVPTELKNRFPPTFELAMLSSLIALLVAVPVGTLAALNQDGWLDRFFQVGTALGLAVPNFVIATLIFVLPALWWGWTPKIGYVDLWDDPVENISRLWIPAVIMGIAQAALLTRLTRSAVLEVVRQDFVRTAFSKGLNRRTVHTRHTLRNAILPVLTVFGLQLSALLGGTVIIESIFVIPGIGSAFIEAIRFRDYPLAQMLILVLGLLYLGVNLVVDLLYGVVDPRIRYT